MTDDDDPNAEHRCACGAEIPADAELCDDCAAKQYLT